MSDASPAESSRLPRTYAIALLPFALVTLWAIVAHIYERVAPHVPSADGGATDASRDASRDAR
jgi:hypothetical protein